MEIMEIIKNVSSILAYFFDPSTRRRRERETIWNTFRVKQLEFRQAVADGDPQKAAVLSKEMEVLREKYRFLYLAGK